MGSVLLRTMSELRARWRAALGLALVIGIAGGTVLAAAAGARRTDSSYPRFLRQTNAIHGAIANGGESFGFANVDFDVIEKLPQVADSARTKFFTVFIKTPGGLLLTPIGDRNPVVVFSGPDTKFGGTLNRLIAREGRLPDPTKVDEIAVGYEAASRYHIHVNDVFQVAIPNYADLKAAFSGSSPMTEMSSVQGPHLTMRVTAIVIAPGELPPGLGYPQMHFTPAFYRAYSSAPSFDAIAFKLGSDADVPSFLSDVTAKAIAGPVGGTPRVEFLSVLANTLSLERTAYVQAVALWLLGGLLALASVLIVAQTVARQVFLESGEYRTLAALGVTRTQLFGIAMARLSIVAVTGALVAGVSAYLASPFAPISLVRITEPHKGFAFDGSVIGLGVAAIVGIVLLLGVIPAMRASRIDSAERYLRGAEHPSRVADALARTGFSPTAVSGVRMALEPGRGRALVPVRSTLIGAIVGIAAIAGGLTFAASLDHVAKTPRLQGWNWDIVVGDDFDADTSAYVLPVLRSTAGVVDISAGGAGDLTIGSQNVAALGADRVTGDIEPVILDGRTAERDDEIVLGARTLRETRAHVGETIRVKAGARSFDMRIVGRGVAPAVANEAFSGRGAFLTFAALQKLYPKNAMDIYLVRARRGADVNAMIASMKKKIPNVAIVAKPIDGEISALSHVTNLPLILAGLLALLAAMTLGHMLATAIRRRRAELAILKTLGFLRRQVRATVAWQATTLGVIALVLGLPLGVAAGRWAWALFADQAGVPFVPVVHPLTLALVIPGTLIVANGVALLPARNAARTQAAVALRTEG